MKSLAEVHLHQKALAKEGIYVRALMSYQHFPSRHTPKTPAISLQSAPSAHASSAPCQHCVSKLAAIETFPRSAKVTI
jgi:hypothetical protein